MQKENPDDPVYLVKWIFLFGVITCIMANGALILKLSGKDDAAWMTLTIGCFYGLCGLIFIYRFCKGQVQRGALKIERACERQRNEWKKFWLFPKRAALDRSGYTHQWNFLWWKFQWRFDHESSARRLS